MGESRSSDSLRRLTPARRRVLDRLLDQALDLESDARNRFVEDCRARAPRLGAWLDRLLSASSEPAAFLDRSARDLVSDALESRESPPVDALPAGTRLGPWRLLELVGSGGMGEVYRAERADGAFEMAAAIKIIRSPSEDLAELLSAERQVMARLNHASIARLLDGGVTEDGRPYLVMEWVDGLTLSEWVQEHDPAVDEMLGVFRDACNAISVAHRQLIVHGDVKPSNLIVMADGQARLVDFGVSKLLDSSALEQRPGALTPGFSAPEQMAGEPVSTAADIYSLGALLHWLVYGRGPSSQPRKVLPRWSRYRRLKDLIAIVNQATAADPEDRYVTVNAMLLELGRIQEDRPVRARSPGPLERFGLWVRRHRVGAALGGVALVSVVAGISVVLWQARVVALERDVARTEAALSEAVRNHLIFLFREVGSLAEDTEELGARELLDRTVEVAEDWLSDDPAIQQQVLAVLGEIMIALHDYSSAEPLLAGFVEYDDEHVSPVLRSMAFRDLAQVYHRQGRMEEGFEVADQSVVILEEFPGAHPARMSDALQVRGRLHRDLGRWEQALADLRRSRELAVQASSGPRPLMARAENNLATTLLIGGQLEGAARHLEAAEALWFALERGDSNDALSVMGNLALTLDRLGRTDEAEKRLRKVIEVRADKYGDSGAMAAARISLGRLLTVRGQFEEAANHLGKAREIARRFVGEQSPDHAAALIGLGELHQDRGEAEVALGHFEQAAEIMVERLGPTHPYSIQARLGVIDARVDLDDEPDLGAYADLIETARNAGGAAAPVLASALCRLAIRNIAQGEHEAARTHARECLEIRKDRGLGGWRVSEGRAIELVARQLSGADQVPESQVHEAMSTLAGQTHPDHPLVTRISRQFEHRSGERLADRESGETE